MSALVLGLDLGGTKIAALLVDAADRVVASEVVASGPDAVPDELVALAVRTVAAAPSSGAGLAAVGVGAPGSVDAARGTLRFAINVRAHDIPVGPLLAARLGVPCFVEHDARAAALYLATLEPDRRALGFLAVGTGISAGVVVEGRPMRGARGLAGEVGHVVARPGGPACPCGLDGCLEAVAAGPAIARLAGDVPAAVERAVARGATTATAADLYEAAAAGDARAGAVADEIGRDLARAVRGLVLTFGLDRLIVGGGVARAGAPFFEPILRALEDERARSGLVREAVGPDVVRLLPPEVDAGARGAVTVARAGIREGPGRAGPGWKEGG